MKEGERLTAVLVADMSRSTEQRARIGDELADHVRRVFEWILVDVVGEAGGEVVAGTGDGALASFERASAALEAAIALQQRVDRHNIRLDADERLRLRVGVGAGDVDVGGAELAGVAVTTATDLCDRAAPGTILASLEVVELAGSRFAGASPSFPAAHDDGEPVRIDWEPLPSMSELLGLPEELSVSTQLPFAGRDELLGRLRAELLAPDGAVVVGIAGEAGIGKTRLTAELTRSLHADGVSILYGRSPSGVARPYRPLVTMFERWLAVDPSARRAVEPYIEAVARLLPELGTSAAPDDDSADTATDAEVARRRMYDGAVRWLRAITDYGPAVLVLDDAHSAQPSTLDLLGHLVATLAEAPLRVLVVHRTVEASIEDRLATWLARVDAIEVALEPLDRAAVAELVDGLELDEAAIDTLHSATAGNPLYLGEVIRSLEEGVEGGLSLPESVRGAIELRIERLRAEVRTVLQGASVLGSNFDLAILRPMAVGIDVIGSIDELVGSGLVEPLEGPGLRYRFAHGLVREIASASMSPARRAGWHEQAALALEADSRGAAAQDIARHYLAAIDLGHHAEALAYTERAARQALDAFADHQAAELYARAIEVADEMAGVGVERRARLLIGHGEALRRLGEPEHRAVLDAAADLAERTGDGPLLARALLAGYLGTFRGAVSFDEELLRRIDVALQLPMDDRLRARLLAVAAVETTWHPTRGHTAAELADEALALARTLGDEAVVAEVIARRHWVVFYPLSDRVATTVELRTLSTELDNPGLRFEAALGWVFTAHRLGDRSARDEALNGLIEISGRLDQPPMRWLTEMWRATTALIDGRLADASASIDIGHRIATGIEFFDAEIQRSTQRFWLSFDRHALDPERGDRLAATVLFPEARISWPSFAHRCAEDGLLEPTARLVEACWADDRFLEPAYQQVWIWNLCHLARAAAAVRDQPSARRLLDVLEGHREEQAVMVFSSVGSVARYTGLLAAAMGDRAAAIRDLTRAQQANVAAGAVGWAMRVELDLAELGFGDDGHAIGGPIRSPAAIATEADTLGLGAIAARARLF